MGQAKIETSGIIQNSTSGSISRGMSIPAWAPVALARICSFQLSWMTFSFLPHMNMSFGIILLILKKCGLISFLPDLAINFCVMTDIS